MSPSIKYIIIVATTLFLGTFAIVGLWAGKINAVPPPTPVQAEIVATTWRWVKMVSLPVPITNPDVFDKEISRGTRLLRVEFEYAGGIMSAMVGGDPFDVRYWRVGDEVLIASAPVRLFPTLGASNNISTTYIVVNHRVPEKKK